MVRNITEMALCIIRMSIVYKNKKLFVGEATTEIDEEQSNENKSSEFEKHEVANDIISASIQDNNDL